MELFRILGSIFVDDKQPNEALDNVEKKAGGLQDKFKSVGSGMAKTGAAIAVGVGVIGGALYGVAADADQANRKIQASLGLTQEETQAVADQARKVWKEGYTSSLQEASDQILAVKSQMQDLNNADLANVTQQAMSLSKTFGDDVGEVARSADMLMNQFGITSEKAMDLLAVGYQKGLNYSGEFLDSVNEYSVYFQEMGYSAEEAFAILATGAENGAFNLDKVGDAVKENFLRLSDMGKEQISAMEALGLSSEEVSAKINAGGESAQSAYGQVMTALASVKDETERNAIGVQIFGTQWEDLGQKVVTAMNPSVEVLGEVEGAVNKVDDAMSSSAGQQFQASMNTLKDSLVPLGTTLLNIANDVIPKVSGAIQTLAGWFTNLSPEAQKTILVVGGIVGGLGALLVALAPVITMIATLIPLFTAGGAAAGVIGTAIAALSGPVGIAIAVITALIAIGIALYKNWDEISAKASEVFTWLGNFISVTASQIAAVWTAGWSTVRDYFLTVVNILKTYAETYFAVIGEIISGLVQTAIAIFNGDFQSIPGIWSGVWDTITGLVSGAKDKILGFVEDMVGSIGGFLGTLQKGIDKIKEFLGLKEKSDKKEKSSSSKKSSSSSSTPQPNYTPTNSLQRYARGTDNAKGGMAVVGERGREIIYTPPGSKVIPNNKTEELLGRNVEVHQELHFHSDNLTPSEIERKQKYAWQDLALQWE
ncbi:phage tail tape measure protein [Metabacillus litoralis]|uniref:phage tail tape measure protein n=1 Tax=Metabacillus litoralis TaxID=152268 RepID=UPI00203A5430|nr:phage tail tape measure protein [Metabacillus litoralis]MCM3160983.1 phage tail tape measure protein [Metabacillus litoralis]